MVVLYRRDEVLVKVAITGSRHGLRTPQETRLIDLFCSTRISEFHYGDCRGVDEQALWLWVQCGSGVAHSHPATLNPEWDEKWRAHTALFEELGIVEHEPKHPLERNRDMVNACDALWAFPENDLGHGGTWYTIRYALDNDVPVTIVEAQ